MDILKITEYLNKNYQMKKTKNWIILFEKSQKQNKIFFKNKNEYEKSKTIFKCI